MRYLLYSILATAIAGGAVMGTQGSPASSQGSEAKDAKEPPDAKQAAEPSSREKESRTEAQQEKELKPFTPSEKVPVDSAISFPVDI